MKLLRAFVVVLQVCSISAMVVFAYLWVKSDPGSYDPWITFLTIISSILSSILSHRLKIESVEGDINWADVIEQVKVNLAKIYSYDLETMEVKSWEPQKRGRRIKLVILAGKTDTSPSPGGATFWVGLNRIVWADRKGNVLHCRNEGYSSSKDKKWR